jgi:hypothetical protein
VNAELHFYDTGISRSKPTPTRSVRPSASFAASRQVMDTSAQNRKMEKVAIRSVQQVTVNSVIAQSDSVPDPLCARQRRRGKQ